jgi:uncharacterized membrane protein SpoIIM required for sporulation
MAELAPQPEQSPRISWELLDRRRLIIILGILLIEFAIFVVGLFTPIPKSDQQTLANETDSQFASIQSASPAQLVLFIFFHNLTIALVEMAPVIGAFLFVYSVYSTGLIAQVIAVSQGLPGQVGAIIFVFPYSLVELSAYAIAVGSGIMLLVALRKKQLHREIRVFVLEAVVVTGVLFVAAVMETATKFSPALGFALWLPTGLGIAGLIVLSSRKKV